MSVKAHGCQRMGTSFLKEGGDCYMSPSSVLFLFSFHVAEHQWRWRGRTTWRGRVAQHQQKIEWWGWHIGSEQWGESVNEKWWIWRRRNEGRGEGMNDEYKRTWIRKNADSECGRNTSSDLVVLLVLYLASFVIVVLDEKRWRRSSGVGHGQE